MLGADHRQVPQPANSAMAETALVAVEEPEIVEVCLRSPPPIVLEAVYRSQHHSQRPGRIPKLRALEIPP